MSRRLANVGWIVLGVAVLLFELSGVKAVCRTLGIPRTHDSLSAEVWKLPTWARVGVAAFLWDVSVHFVFHTPLLPAIG